MSILSNRAAHAADEAPAYVAAVLDLLGERDPIAVLTGTAPALQLLLEQVPTNQVTTPEAPGKWSIRHVLQHLADSELVWGYRLRTVLADDRPRLTGYDQDRWAERLGYDQAEAAQAVQDFAVLRRANLRLLAALPEEGWARVGLHADRGEESVHHMVRLYAGHDLAHLRQLQRIRVAVAGAGPGSGPAPQDSP